MGKFSYSVKNVTFFSLFHHFFIYKTWKMVYNDSVMQTFNKINCQKLRADLNKVLAAYGANEGITFEIGNMRFSSNEVRITSMTARVAGTPKREEKALAHQFSVHGLKEVNSRGDRLVEYNSRRYAYPFVFIDASDGRRYKCSLTQAQRRGF